MVSYQPTNRVFSEQLFVFPLDNDSPFATLQSHIHEGWARLLSSTMKSDLRYSASDCFETFPFPSPDPRTVIPELEDIGQRLYTARADYMVANQQGLTQTYNRMKDPDCQDPEILRLRDLSVELDRAVLEAYGWSDLIPQVPPFTPPQTDDEKRAMALFEDTIIDRLFALNAERAQSESITGASTSKKPTKPRKPRRPVSAQLDLKPKGE